MKLNYKDSGSGVPVVIMHGLFGMLDNWQSVAKKLEESYRCILVDLRNHGKSPHSPDMNYKLMAEDVAEMIDDLKLSNAVVLGHSMGGKVAMQLALDHGENIEKLIVVDIAPGPYPPHHAKVIEAIESLEMDTIETRNDAETVLQQYLGEDRETIQFLLKNIARLPDGGFKWKANMPGIIANYDHLMAGIETNTAFEKPALFIAGEHSSSIQKDRDWPLIQKLFPAAQYVMIQNAGHWVHADRPAELIEALHLFMNS